MFSKRFLYYWNVLKVILILALILWHSFELFEIFTVTNDFVEQQTETQNDDPEYTAIVKYSNPL